MLKRVRALLPKAWPLRRELVVLLGVAVCVSGCGGGLARQQTRPRMSVTPSVSVEDQSLGITVRGLAPREVVSLALSSNDAAGVRWVSSANFVASANGVVNLSRAAPRSGPYSGVWGMGLLTMMHPVGSAPAGAYSWSGTQSMRFTLAIMAGSKTLASGNFMRRFSDRPLTTRSLSFRDDGFVGRFVSPTGATRRPAVLLLGGSTGGIPSPLLSGVLAAHGYSVLALGYFNLPGLPQQLLRIPLEYFERALAWLRRQPQVDPRHVAVLGISRGSEAALLSGAYFPQLAGAVIAMVPSDAAICSYPGCRGPAWTFHGRAVPFTRELDAPRPTDNPHAVIPVQRIRGPIFLACATADMSWTSCPYARAIMAHLNAAHDRFVHTLYAYGGAGHFVGFFVPYEPELPSLSGPDKPQSDQRARALDWTRLLGFLATFARTG